jgi:hypothetical protein
MRRVSLAMLLLTKLQTAQMIFVSVTSIGIFGISVDSPAPSGPCTGLESRNWTLSVQVMHGPGWVQYP